MGLITTIQNKTEQVRAKERIRPLLESRMMRDILLEIGQRGTEKLDPQSVPLEQRPLATKRAAECGTAGLQQSVIREVLLDETGIILYAGTGEVRFLYGDYNYEKHRGHRLSARRGAVSCPASARLLQHYPYLLLGPPAPNGPLRDGKRPRQVFVRRHHEDTPFDPQPTRKQKLF